MNKRVLAIMVLMTMTMVVALVRGSGSRVAEIKRRICHSFPEYGHCGGHSRMWHYDYQARRCNQFTYSNCGGNRNRFYSEEDCIQYCNNQFFSDLADRERQQDIKKLN
ncbi:kunitz-type serine protease inhibitor 2-like [Scaptodrosophila lebanonensis]|uniref:Kunitz-type serine protease inhibitor 2-like n=1 Tax=Drosophila lebanonensis TaxID=7225 RepID=A0A6J2T8H8_DROLE|nr:kunitz-type serine protease inhibitor 2-like [Scaptodrosophila lebanonensis]